MRCNQHVKFRPVLQRAAALGAEYVATGHYVRRDQRPGQRALPPAQGPGRRPRTSRTSSSPCSQDELARTLFPLGDCDKAETRDLAARFGLPVAGKAESMEICFVPDNKYGRYVTATAPEAAQPGPILDSQGRYLGEHPGIVHFTVGPAQGPGPGRRTPLLRPGHRAGAQRRDRRLGRGPPRPAS